MRTTLLMVLLSTMLTARSQDIERAIKGNKIIITGNIASMQSINIVKGKNGSRKPFNYLLQGNINIQLFENVDLPFSFVSSNAGARFTQPTFNQNSVHPKYKWAQLHLGSISVSYSPHTISGYVFKGVAIDLSPKNLKFGAFYGKLQNAIFDTTLHSNNAIANASYKRIGMGVQLGFAPKKMAIESNIFYAQDDEKSLPKIPIHLQLTPSKNLAYSLKTSITLFKKVQWQNEISTSILVDNTLNKNRELYHLPLNLYSLHINGSIHTFHAVKQSISYQSNKNFNVTINYEKIDPNYKTLGAYYFTNDFENITMGCGFTMFKNKVQISSQFGLQHDNLNKTKLNELTRKVGNCNVNFVPSKTVNCNFSYSNFLSYTNTRPFTDYQVSNPEYLRLDTFNFRQISENITGNVNLKIGKSKTILQNILIGAVIQSNKNNQKNAVEMAYFINANVGYNLTSSKSNTTISIALNAGQNQMNLSVLRNYSPVLSVSKPMLKKLVKFNMSVSHTSSFNNNMNIGKTVNIRSGLNYMFRKIHNFSLQGTFIKRTESSAQNVNYGSRNYHEYNISLQYNVNLGTIKK